jgi:hypothetical protein
MANGRQRERLETPRITSKGSARELSITRNRFLIFAEAQRSFDSFGMDHLPLKPRRKEEKERRDDEVNYAGFVVQLELQEDESGERKRAEN